MLFAQQPDLISLVVLINLSSQRCQIRGFGAIYNSLIEYFFIQFSLFVAEETEENRTLYINDIDANKRKKFAVSHFHEFSFSFLL